MPSKRDLLLASLAGSGTVSDRLYAEQEALALNPNPPVSLSDLFALNGTDKNIIQ